MIGTVFVMMAKTRVIGMEEDLVVSNIYCDINFLSEAPIDFLLRQL